MSSNPTLIPHIVVSNGAAAIEFYKKAFGAVELSRHLFPDSTKIMHASLAINGATLMLHDDCSAEMKSHPETPEALGGSPVTLHLQVSDAYAVWAQATDAGAEVAFPLKDQFWGDRYGALRDPFGHKWSIGQTVRRPTTAEVEEGAKLAFAGQ